MSSEAMVTKGGRRRRRPWNLYIGTVLVGLVTAMAVISWLWLPHDPVEVRVLDRFQSPSGDHWLGTDQFGRDLLSRILVGARTTIVVGLIAVAVGVTIGTVLGSIAAFVGGWTDELLMRFLDAVAAY